MVDRRRLSVLLAVGSLCALTSACKNLTPAQQAKLDRFECEAEALAPVLPPALDAAETLRALYTGEADLSQLLRVLALTRAEAQALVARLNACDPRPAPEPPPPAAPPAPAVGEQI